MALLVSILAVQLGMTLPSRRVVLTSSAAAIGGCVPPGLAFSPDGADVVKQATESEICREPGCRDAALKKLEVLLDTTGVDTNIKGDPASHSIDIVKCAAFTEVDEPGKITLKIKAIAEGLDLMDYISVIWLANKSKGTILAARAQTDEDIEGGGAPVVKYETSITTAQLIDMENDLLVPRLFCTSHGLWEGKPFTLAQYLNKGGEGDAELVGEKKIGPI